MQTNRPVFPFPARAAVALVLAAAAGCDCGGRTTAVLPTLELAPEALPLERCLDSFWRPGRQIDEMPSETEPFAPHALLRRLGPSPLQGKFPLVGLLASIYDSIAENGRKLRDDE